MKHDKELSCHFSSDLTTPLLSEEERAASAENEVALSAAAGTTTPAYEPPPYQAPSVAAVGTGFYTGYFPEGEPLFDSKFRR